MRRLWRIIEGKRSTSRIRVLVHPTVLAAAAILALAIGLAAHAQQSAPPSEKTAAQQFKNIQILKDVPASQLIPGMRYITTALGVQCSFCHVEGNFASDDKQEKQTARHMMTMLFAINKENFGGRPEVSCYTCHQGHHEPMGVPALPADAVEPQFIRPPEGSTPQPLPTPDAVLAKYAQAVGGEAASKIQTREIQAQDTMMGQTFSVDGYQKAPNQAYYSGKTSMGPMTMGFDGSQAWIATQRGVERLHGPDEILLSRQAQVDPVAALSAYTAKRVRGQAKIGDATAYVMQATAPDGVVEFLFFDEQSGLLLRRMIRDRTIFGALPIEADYADYREVDGVNMPHTIKWYTPGDTSTISISGVKNNVPVDDSKFAPPKQSQ